MKTYLFLATAMALSCGCSQSSTTYNGHPPTSVTINCIGTAFYWTDVVGEEDSAHVQAVWTRAVDSSWATLQTVSSKGVRDTVLLLHSSDGWKYDPRDSRSEFGWDPVVTEKKDSIMLGMGFGFSGTDYELRKE